VYSLLSNIVLGQLIRLSPNSEYYLKILDYVTPRYFIIYNENKHSVIFWNIDTEYQHSIKLPDTYFGFINSDQEKQKMVPDIIPISNNKYGILHIISVGSGFQYSIIDSDHINESQIFTLDRIYTYAEYTKFKGDNCLFLMNDSYGCYRKCEDFSFVAHKEYVLPAIPRMHVAHCFINDKYIDIGFEEKEITIWHMIENKKITAFQGRIYHAGLEIDNSGELGIFYSPPISIYDIRNSKYKPLLPRRSIQVRSLNTGDIEAQVLSENENIMGVKFSPVDPQILLLYHWYPTDKAVLWQYSSLDHSGKILAKMSLPLNNKVKKDSNKTIVNYYGVFSSDGKKVVFVTNDLKIYIYSADTGKLLRRDTIRKPVGNSSNE
jgi:hypothetical protein